MSPEENRGNPTEISIAKCRRPLLPIMSLCTVVDTNVGLVVFSRKFVICVVVSDYHYPNRSFHFVPEEKKNIFFVNSKRTASH